MIDMTFLEHKNSFEEFKAISDQICGEFNVCPGGAPAAFRGCIGSIQRHSLDIGLVGIRNCRVTRDQKSLKLAPLETVFLIYQEMGAAHIRNSCWDVNLEAGDMVLVDGTRTSLFDFDGKSSQQISIPLPRNDTVELLGIAALGGMAFRGEEALSPVIGRYLKRLVNDDVDQDPCETLMGYLRVSVQDKMGRNDLGFSFAEGLTSINAVVEQSCTDPSFGAPELAERLGLTLRTVQRFFEVLGITPREHILSFRLEAARRLLLAQHAHARVNIASVAYDSGFNDLSYFYRTFSKAYGLGPGEFMRHALGKRQPSPAGK